MPAPDTIDLGSSGGGLWPAFTLSGVTGTGAASINGDYFLSPVVSAGLREYIREGGGASVVQFTAEVWDIFLGEVVQFTADDAVFPWLAASWDIEDAATGTPAFTRILAAPGTLDLTSGGELAPATFETDLTGTNNDLLFQALLPGRLGNDVRVRYVDPAANNATISVSVSGRDITVNLATDGSGVITSTALNVGTAVAALPAAAALVTVTLKSGNDGSGVVTAMAYTALAGGTGGLPLPPDTITL